MRVCFGYRTNNDGIKRHRFILQNVDNVQRESEEEPIAVLSLQDDNGRRRQSGHEQSVGGRLVGAVHVGQESGPVDLQRRGA